MKWTPEEIALLKHLYCNTKMPYEKISAMLNRSTSAIKTKAHCMGLQYNNGLPLETKVDSFEQWNVCSFVVEQMRKKKRA